MTSWYHWVISCGNKDLFSGIKVLMIPKFTLRSAWFWCICGRYPLGLQLRGNQRYCAEYSRGTGMCTNNEHVYYKKTTQDSVLWQPFWIFSGHVWFFVVCLFVCCCCCFCCCLFDVVVVAAAAAVVVSACFNICDTFIHLVEKQHLQTLRNIGNLQTQF